MHNAIMGQKGIDHHDADALNNQRYNLRRSNQSQNMANQRKTRGSSKYKGVSWSKDKKKWEAKVKKDGHTHHLGRFRDEVDAALAYNLVAYELFGDFARLNTPLVKS